MGDDSITDNQRKDDLDSRYDDNLYAHETIKTELIKAYRERNFDSLVFKTFVIDEKFRLASAGTLMAEIVSPHKSSIVYFDQTEHLLRRPAIILTVFPDPAKESTNIILGCLKSDKNAILYLDKYNSLEPKEVLLAVSSLMLTTNRNNTFFHPLYWDAIQKHPLKIHFESEIKKDRGFDLINQDIQLSKFNLFDKNLVWDKIKPDANN